MYSNTKYQETAAIYEKLFQKSISEEFVKTHFTSIHGCGLRICHIAEGLETIYISKGKRGGVWDYCSSDIILREAGGFISDLKGNPLNYRSNQGILSQGAVVCGNYHLYAQAIDYSSKD